MDHIDRAEFAAGMVRVVALHDPDTATHLRATATLARRIAARLHLAAPVINAIELAAMLHDIGKVNVRRAVLRKDSTLTAPEWDEMRVHAQIGADALQSIAPLAHLAPIVRAHHERIDGQGYPDRLRGDEIPLEARVVAVADAFHALTTDRPYRRAAVPAMALSVLSCAAGPQFDVDVVGALVAVFSDQNTAHRRSA